MKKNKKNIKENLIMDKINIIGSFILLGLPIISQIFSTNFEFIRTLPLCLILLVFIFLNLSKNRDNNQSNILCIGSFVILLINIFFCMFSKNIYLSLENIILYGTSILLCITSSNVFKDKKFIVLFSLFLVAFTGIVSIWYFRDCALTSGGGSLFWSKLSNGTLDRLFGPFINPNFFAGFLSMVLPISIGSIFIFKEKKYSFIASCSSIFILICLCLTGSKFGFISLFFGLIGMIIALIKTKSFNKQTIKPIIIISLILLVFFGLFSKTLVSRIESANTTQIHSTEFRIFTWKATLNMIKENPIIGVFPGRFSEAYPQYTIAAITKHAHSSYLQFASEYGIIIFILTLVGLVYIYMYSLKFNRDNFETYDFIDTSKISFLYAGLLGGFISEIIHNLVDSDFYIGSHILVFSLICGIFLSFNKTETTPKFIQDKYANLSLIYLLACLWLSISVILFVREDFKNSYSIFPNNYMALRELGKKTNNSNISYEYFKRAAKKAPEDYYSYQLLGNQLFKDNSKKDTCILYYEKALKYHPHSTLNMMKIIDWAKLNNRDDILYKYCEKLIDQETSCYETLKGVPELVDTNYAVAHIYLGDREENQEHIDKAIYHYKQASKRYSKCFDSNNLNFLFASLINRQKTLEDYELILNQGIFAYKKLEELENKSYNKEINNIQDLYNKLEEQYSSFYKY